MGTHKNLQADYAGDLIAALTAMAPLGGGRLDIQGVVNTTEVDLDEDFVTGDVELVGIGGPGHARIVSPVDDTLFAVANNPSNTVRMKGLYLQGPTTGLGQATIVTTSTYSLELEDCVVSGGTHGCVIINPGTLRASIRNVRFKDVLGNPSRLNPIALWVFDGGGSEYLYVEADFETVHGSGFVLDAGSNEAGPHTMVRNFQVPRLRFRDVATAVGAAAVIDCQSAGPGLIGQVIIEGGGGTGAGGVVFKNDQYYGEAGITKTSGINIAQLRMANFDGHYVYFDGVERNRIGYYQAEGCAAGRYMAYFNADKPSPVVAGGGTDYACRYNVIDYLDWRLSPNSDGILFNAVDDACDSNLVRAYHPTGLRAKTVFGGTAVKSGPTRNRVLAA